MAILIFVISLFVTIIPVSIFYIKRKHRYVHYKKAKKQLKLLHQDIHDAKIKNKERRDTFGSKRKQKGNGSI